MKNVFVFFCLLSAQYALAQQPVRYTGSLEVSALRFQSRTLTVEPGPNWKGYNLNQQQHGTMLSLINGLVYHNRLFAGLGLGWLHFDGINGVSVFGDLSCLVTKTRLAPVVGVRVGYTHLRNQYEGGTGSLLSELDGGLSYSFTKRLTAEVRTGIAFTQQAAFVPLKLRLRF
ncbi:hypothetical protein LC612_42535 [Nostoc sp. CHAB 5834]|nr:hypothetical protein [Nostoc sp. CHAB 5834]